MVKKEERKKNIKRRFIIIIAIVVLVGFGFLMVRSYFTKKPVEGDKVKLSLDSLIIYRTPTSNYFIELKGLNEEKNVVTLRISKVGGKKEIVSLFKEGYVEVMGLKIEVISINNDSVVISLSSSFRGRPEEGIYVNEGEESIMYVGNTYVVGEDGISITIINISNKSEGRDYNKETTEKIAALAIWPNTEREKTLYIEGNRIYRIETYSELKKLLLYISVKNIEEDHVVLTVRSFFRGYRSINNIGEPLIFYGDLSRNNKIVIGKDGIAAFTYRNETFGISLLEIKNNSVIIEILKKINNKFSLVDVAKEIDGKINILNESFHIAYKSKDFVIMEKLSRDE